MKSFARLFLIAVLIGLPLFARQTVAATLFTATVTDRAGVGIDDASILIERNNQSWKLLSDKNGQFKISLPNGAFKIAIARTAFKELTGEFKVSGESAIIRTFELPIDCCIDTITIQPDNSIAARTASDGNAVPAVAPEPNIGVNGYFATDRAQRGRLLQAAIVMEIPSGYHVNANRPLNKYSIPTSLKIEASNGARAGVVTYPRAIVRKLQAVNNEALAVYEGRAILRFSVMVPAGYSEGSIHLKAHLRFQSCNDEVCFPPRNQDVEMDIDVVGANERVQRTNGWVFGRR